MQTVRTPYLEMQTIRRTYADQGLWYRALPFTYQVVVNFTDQTTAQRGTGVLTIDADSDFWWQSTYRFFQNAPYTAGIGITGTPSSGQVTPELPANQVEINLRQLAGATPFHRTQIFPTAVGLGLNDTADLTILEMDHAEQGVAFDSGSNAYGASLAYQEISREMATPTNVGVHPSEVETEESIGYWRAYLPEPVMLPRGAQFEVALRRIVVLVGAPQTGNLVVFHGVRVYTGRD